ncbi:hypothetical protein ACSBR1_037393 [Camellia fascicularis]
MRKVKRCFTCYKPTDRADDGKSLKNCMYYSEMSAEERNEKITSAISYCKVANFEYIDEVEAAAEEEARKASTENKTTTNSPDRASYWEESLKDRYEVQKVEEFNAMGKGNRSRKQMVSVEDEGLAGLEDVSSEGEDNNYEVELTDEETAASGILTGRRPYSKKIRVDSAESLPLMEGEGRSFRVKGFNQNQRAAFVQIMMRFGVGEFDWAEFTPRLKQKTCEEIKDSGACQTSHWKSGHKTKCKDFQLSGQVKSMQSAYMQHGRRDSSAVALVPSSGTVNITEQSKEILFPYEDFVELFNWDKRGFPPCGLLNCGNSCFANVVLQCLVYTRPLVAYLLEKGHRKECRRNDWCFLCEFQTHVERSSESRHPFSPINILSRLSNIGGDLGYGKQEDAHEFMRFAIDTMQSVCLDEFGGEKALHPSTQETTLIQHIFGGHLQSQVICSKCNNVSNQYEDMMDLTVEIQGDATSLEECLDLFTVRERLHGDNMYKCDGCNEYVMAWKRLTVRRAPNILTIALKRFQSGRFGKLNKRVTFPETLDLSPYMSEVGDGNDVYKLYAVVVHVDMLNASFFGHYICYTKDFCGKWYRIDDCKVMRVDLEEVLSQGAYMLLYSRVCARPSCQKPIESLTKGKQQTVQEGEPHVKQSVEVLTTAESINGICTSGSLSSDSYSQEKVSTCEKERTNSEDVREDIEMVDSESSSSVPQDIEVHGNGYSHAIGETASPVVHANRLVSAVGYSLSEMVKPEAYSQNSESDFPHSAVDENTAERSSAERLTESSSDSAQPIQNGVCEEGKISHDAPVGNLSSGELLDEISPVDCNGEQAKMETGKGLPSSSSTKDATGKLARRNSSEGKLKPLFPPGFLRKHSGNNSPKRGGKAKAPSELAECASSYNPNKVILVDLQNLVFLIKMVRGQKMWESLIPSAVVLRLLLLRNELGITWTRTLWCSVDLVILITAMEILVLLLFLMRALAILMGMTNNWQGKPRATRRSSMRVKLHPKRSEQILKDRWKVTCNLSEDDSTTQILFEASTLSMDLHLRLKS